MATNFTDKNISAISIGDVTYNIKSIPFHATEVEWLAIDYVPKAGEMIIYDSDEKCNYPRFKTGDGVSQVRLLPFSLATISETQVYINSQIGSAGHLKRVILDIGEELPSVEEASVDTIYMKLSPGGLLTDDVYEEYMVINGSWEKIGNTRVDLSGYVTSVNGQTGDVTIEIPEISPQVQSDWNQTDETATNYIKNKPSLATSEEIKVLFN